MFIRIRVPAKRTTQVPLSAPTAYPIRFRSLLASAALHLAAVICLALVSPDQPPSDRPILDEIIQPEKHKIIYYDFRKKKTDVEPPTKVGDSPRPRATEISPQTAIATAPNAKSAQQHIWLPAPKIEIKQDLPSPNLIARLNTAVPTLPAPPKEVPKPPVEAPKAPVPNNAVPEPKGDPNHAPDSTNNAPVPTKQVKAFVPPPPSPAKPKLALPTVISDAPAPAISSSSMANRLPVGAGMPAFQNAGPPPPNAQPGPPNAGNANVDVAVASLHPSNDAKNSLPEGERPGRFAKAPEAGPASSGDLGKTASLFVPNLTIREPKPVEPAKAAPEQNTRPVLYTDRVRTVPFSTLSVPLRPSSRSIPRSVDAVFQGRNVYTMVVPIENLPAYVGDWILWFAERNPVPGETPVMRSPLPFRKLEPLELKPAGPSGAERVQISAVLEKDGRFGRIAVPAKAGTDLEQTVVQDLQAWQFKPATRDGVPIDVDVILEITFNLAQTPAKRSQP